MERTQRHGNVRTVVGPALVLHRVDDHDRLIRRFGGRAQFRADLFSVGVLQVVEDR